MPETGGIASMIGYRAEQLALVLLTRRDDLVVHQLPTDSGIDLLVALRKDGKETGRQFGVQVKATAQPLTHQHNGGVILPRVSVSQTTQQRLRDLTIPVALFYFAMRDGDRAYFRWLLEPDPAVPAAPRWNSNERAVEMTSDLLDKIVEQIDHWYDVRQVRLAA